MAWPAGPDAEAICLVDGFFLPDCEVSHRKLIRGDSTSAAVAAASVIAKVTRDRYMIERADSIPAAASRDTWATRATSTARRSWRTAISPLHRLSFAVASATRQLRGRLVPSAIAAQKAVSMCSTSIDAGRRG